MNHTAYAWTFRTLRASFRWVNLSQQIANRYCPDTPSYTGVCDAGITASDPGISKRLGLGTRFPWAPSKTLHTVPMDPQRRPKGTGV